MAAPFAGKVAISGEVCTCPEFSCSGSSLIVLSNLLSNSQSASGWPGFSSSTARRPTTPAPGSACAESPATSPSPDSSSAPSVARESWATPPPPARASALAPSPAEPAPARNTLPPRRVKLVTSGRTRNSVNWRISNCSCHQPAQLASREPVAGQRGAPLRIVLLHLPGGAQFANAARQSRYP